MGEPRGFDISIHFEKWSFYIDFWLWYRAAINGNRGYRWSPRHPFQLMTIPFADDLPDEHDSDWSDYRCLMCGELDADCRCYGE